MEPGTEGFAREWFVYRFGLVSTHFYSLQLEFRERWVHNSNSALGRCPKAPQVNASSPRAKKNEENMQFHTFWGGGKQIIWIKTPALQSLDVNVGDFPLVHSGHAISTVYDIKKCQVPSQTHTIGFVWKGRHIVASQQPYAFCTPLALENWRICPDEYWPNRS